MSSSLMRVLWGRRRRHVRPDGIGRPGRLGRRSGWCCRDLLAGALSAAPAAPQEIALAHLRIHGSFAGRKQRSHPKSSVSIRMPLFSVSYARQALLQDLWRDAARASGARNPAVCSMLTRVRTAVDRVLEQHAAEAGPGGLAYSHYRVDERLAGIHTHVAVLLLPPSLPLVVGPAL